MLSFLWEGDFGTEDLVLRKRFSSPWDQTDHNTFEALLRKHYRLYFPMRRAISLWLCGCPQEGRNPVCDITIARLRCWCQTRDYKHILRCSAQLMRSRGEHGPPGIPIKVDLVSYCVSTILPSFMSCPLYPKHRSKRLLMWFHPVLTASLSCKPDTHFTDKENWDQEKSITHWGPLG